MSQNRINAELYEFIVKIVEDKTRDIRVAREEYDRLVAAIKELATAQRRTEERLNRLAEAQQRTEERLEQLAKRVDQLAEAQRRTEERLKQLAEQVSQLAEAQRRTEERLEQLAERVDQLATAQRRTEERLNRLAEAQQRTEERLEQLAKRVDQLAEAVGKLTAAVHSLRNEMGRLSDTIGFGLEDIGRVVLPGWLHRHLGIEVEELRREFLTLDGEEIEVNLYGEGLRDGQPVIVVGEAKSRIHGEDVQRFHRRTVQKLRKTHGDKIVALLFGYLIHPSAREKARQLGIHVIASYER